ncbi:MAG: hypothetical protein V7K48_13265 [Nostoc sp.]
MDFIVPTYLNQRVSVSIPLRGSKLRAASGREERASLFKTDIAFSQESFD